jgi:hypothetical protein
MREHALTWCILSPWLSRRYGFVVYTDPAVTDVACAGLNGLKMGDRTLTVRRAAEVGSCCQLVAMYNVF